MRFRSLWIAVPACAAAGVVGYSAVSAQESVPRAVPAPGAVRPTLPDTRAAQNMFGPPPANGAKPAEPPPLFFPNASPPPKSEAAIPAPSMPIAATPGALPPNMRPPRVIVESDEPKTLPIIKPAEATVPVIPIATAPPAPTIPAPAPTSPAPAMTLPASTPPAPLPILSQPVAPIAAPVKSGPVPLVPSTPPTVGPTIANLMPFPNLPLSTRQAPSLMIECLAPETVSVGQAFEYILVVKNAGGSAVANVRVEDELPLNSKLIASEPAAQMTGDRLTWNLGTLDANGERRIKVSVKPGDEGDLRSRAMVSFTAAAEARTKVTRPRIAVALAGMDNARVGDEVPFQIRVTNTGSGPATNVLVKAKLSEGLHHPAGGQIEATIDKLPPGETKTITLRALATKAGTNGCSISAVGDGLTAEAASSNVAVVEPLLAAKLTGPAKCLVRSEPEFRIELTNPGSAATDPVQVWAIVPEGFEFVNASDAGNYNAANRTVQWSLPAFAAGSARGLSMKLKATTAADGFVKIIAQSTPVAETGIVQTGVRSGAGRILEVKAEAAVKAEGVPALRFEVVDVEDPVEVGKEALYDIRVVNQGTGPCTNVTLSAQLADGTTVAGATGPTTARGAGQQITFDAMPVLAAKGEAVYRVRVKSTAAGDMKLRVQITCAEIRTPISREENTRFLKD